MENTLQLYQQIVGKEAIERLTHLAHPLKGLNIVHINSTKDMGGVAEILHKMIPLFHSLGLNCRWEIIQGSPDFFQITKSFHNAIQGNRVEISPDQLKLYEETNRQNAEMLAPLLQEADIVFIHDPQPASLLSHFPNRKGKWIWRCHIDASTPYNPVWDFLQTYIAKYDASVFSLAEFTHPLPHPMFVIHPSIDPLSEKNRDISLQEIDEEFTKLHLDRTRPTMLQISRFDFFKDPLGVIKSYRLLKKHHPSLQLILAGGVASDDPESDVVLKEIKKASDGDPDIHTLILPNDANRTVNALQRGSSIVLQKSTREGFGLTVTEGLWKGKPVIGGNTGGIRVQIIDGKTGFLVNTPEGAAYRIRYMLHHPEKVEKMGQRGKEFVREKFLLTRHLQDYLIVIHSLLNHHSENILIS